MSKELDFKSSANVPVFTGLKKGVDQDILSEDLDSLDEVIKKLLKLSNSFLQELDERIAVLHNTFSTLPADEKAELRHRFIAHKINNIAAVLSVTRESISDNLTQEEEKLKEESVETDRQRHFFVIDDVKQVASAIERSIKGGLVSGNQLKVSKIHSPIDAIEAIESGIIPDFIICDIMMPEMTGKEFYDWLQENHPDLTESTAFVTGGTLTDDTNGFQIAMLEQGRLIHKPFRAEDIIGQIRKKFPKL